MSWWGSVPSRWKRSIRSVEGYGAQQTHTVTLCFFSICSKILLQPSSFGNPSAQQVNYIWNVQANRRNCMSNKLMENSFYFKLHKRYNYKYDKLKWTYMTVEYRQMNKLSLVTFCRNSLCILKCNMMVATFMGIKISLWCIKVYVISENV